MPAHHSPQPNLPLDFIGVAVKPSCVTQTSIASINRLFNPRYLHVITTLPENCDVFRSQGPNVVCHLQDELLPGITHHMFGEFLNRRYNVSGDSLHMGRTLAGWYLQQVLKLGAVQAIPQLSDYFVVWDLDMVPLQHMQFIHRDAGGQLQMAVGIGGAVAAGYQASYRRLIGKSLEMAPDGSSFVTHHMVVYKPLMRRFLAVLSGGTELLPPTAAAVTPSNSSSSSSSSSSTSNSIIISDSSSNSSSSSSMSNSSSSVSKSPAVPPYSYSWAWEILNSAGPEHLEQGFSEYASYISWVRQNHPETQYIAHTRDWVRHPLGRGMMRLARLFHPHGCCCPPAALLRVVRFLGYKYTGYEVGHIKSCHYNDVKHDMGYCLGGNGLPTG